MGVDLGKLRTYIPRLSWKTQEQEKTDLRTENEHLLAYVSKVENINRALNIALGDSLIQIDNMRSEAVFLLTAIAFKHGGELKIEQEFFDALNDNQKVRLHIQRQEDNSIVISLETDGEEEDSNATPPHDYSETQPEPENTTDARIQGENPQRNEQ